MNDETRSLPRQGSPSGVRPFFLRCRQRGFSIVAAIFILVVLAGLGGFIVSTSSSQQLSLALDAENSRVQQAARAGIEWGVYQVVKVPSAPGNFTKACEDASYAAPSDPAVLVLPGLESFRIEVICGSANVTEGASDYRVYQVVATACNAAACPASAPGLGYVEHRQEARVKQ